MKFVDEVVIECSSGDGAPGVVHFRREKFVPRGGPDGGNGGRGGNVYVIGDSQKRTLLDFRYKKKHRAENGKVGAGSQKTGADGKDLMIRVPLGTQIFDEETEELLIDVVEAKQYLLLQGGRGGMGNAYFKSPTRQAPDFAQPGETGESKIFKMSLKLIADVGLVGFPNVGKSTFLSVITKAKPKIANYEFTTLAPNLGAVTEGDFLIADIPGLIEGAHTGKGLGIRFLKHIERVKILLFLLDPSRIIDNSSDAYSEADANDLKSLEAILNYQYDKLLYELEQFNPDLLLKPRVVAVSKQDLIPEVETLKIGGVEAFIFSSVAHVGISKLMSHINLQLLREEGSDILTE